MRSIKPPNTAIDSTHTRLSECRERIADRGHDALLLLLDSFDYSLDLDCDVWDFAVRIGALEAAGLNDNDFRWLIGKGFVQHAVETTHFDEESRAFRTDRRTVFEERSTFVLTEDGVRFLRRLTNERKGSSDQAHSRLRLQDDANGWGSSATSGLPLWDRDMQELRIGEVVVKRFKVPAPNQETVLQVFQEEGWPVRIDDPLPQTSDLDPKRRLHDTINALNRNQKQNLIQFRGDGQGQGVRWEFVEKGRKLRRAIRTA